MKSSSLSKLLLAKGIDSPRAYRDALIHDWDPGTKVTCMLEVFMLRRINTKELFQHMKDGEFRLNKKLYSVIWMNMPALIRNEDYCLISFRYCAILERGYSLVRVNNDNPNVQYMSLLNLNDERNLANG